MLFQYIGKGYSKSVCGNCYADMYGTVLPDDVETWVDGLPIGYEKLYLDECVRYCPNCGQTIINAAHLKGINEVVTFAPHLKKDAVVQEVYRARANDYVIGAYYEFHGNPVEAETNFRAYLNNFDPLTKINMLDDFKKIEFADIYRRLGDFDKAAILLKSVGSKLMMDELLRYLLKAETKAVKGVDKSRIAIPKKLNYYIL